ncbi:MAG: phosphoribosylformylglycinamidine synthase subunit PurQ [Thermomicrobiales bacterium]
MTGRIGVISFPGSNGDQDALHAFQHDLGVPARMVDHRETNLAEFAALVLPGGFSYGDYLRCGAIARFSPSMTALRDFVGRGGPVLGICNGFQVLTESHVLPGALLRNRTLRFHSHWTHVRIERSGSAWTTDIPEGTILRLPVAHGEGMYYADEVTLDRLESNRQIVARYCDSGGGVSAEANANGSVASIAAICNEARNVVGIMPHPERAANGIVGGDDGLQLLRSALAFLSVDA